MGAHNALLWDSARARALIAARDIGGVVRLARQARGWRQADLGKDTGYSASTISRLETGHRGSLDVEILRRVARAAGIPPEVLGALLGMSAPVPTTVAVTIGRPAEDNRMRRRVLITGAGLAVPQRMLARLDDALALLPAPARPAAPSEIVGRLARARAWFDASDLIHLVDDLPDLLATAHQAAENGDPDTYARLAACYDVATEALSKIGHYGTSRITADRATAFAERSGSPIAMAAAARCLSIVLRHEDRHQIADQVTLQATTRLEATGLVLPAQSAAYTQMLCTCAYNAAQAADRDRALELIAQAERVAARLPDHPIVGQPFTVTPAQVTLYRVGVHWSLGDAGVALHAGRGLHPGQFPTPERRGRLHTDLARAWWQWGKPDQAARALLAAHRQAPAEVRGRPAIRAIVTDLLERHPRVASVRELGAAVGHQASGRWLTARAGRPLPADWSRGLGGEAEGRQR